MEGGKKLIEKENQKKNGNVGPNVARNYRPYGRGVFGKGLPQKKKAATRESKESKKGKGRRYLRSLSSSR